MKPVKLAECTLCTTEGSVRPFDSHHGGGPGDCGQWRERRASDGYHSRAEALRARR